MHRIIVERVLTWLHRIIVDKLKLFMLESVTSLKSHALKFEVTFSDRPDFKIKMKSIFAT